jgi:hypothetical protein
MRRKLVTPKPAAVPATRLAWWAAFLTTLVLIAGLSAVRSTEAAVLPPVGPVNVPGLIEADDEEDGEDEEVEVEGCEAAEEDEGEEECEAESSSSVPPECFLSSADAAVSADVDHDRIRLAVRYEASTPATVAVDYSLRGAKGALNLKGDQQHFGRSGVFRLTQALTEAEAKRVAAAKTFTVTVRPINAPHACSDFLDQHLAVRRAIPDGSIWVDTESTFRPARHARHH